MSVNKVILSRSKRSKRETAVFTLKAAFFLLIPVFLVINFVSRHKTHLPVEILDSDSDSVDSFYDENEIGLLLDPLKYITRGESRDILASSGTRLTGKFLHITDPHPDPYYQEGGAIDTACHRGISKAESSSGFDIFPAKGGLKTQGSGKPEKLLGSKFGDPMLGCDSPVVLVTSTFQYLQETLSGEIDFIVWTGDNSRHDNDRKIPRTSFEIMGNNMDLAERLRTHFPDIPIVPTIGNNDIYPHNLMELGPSLITRQLGTIYQDMIPEEQRRLYERFGSFFREVIPGKLVVLSLNSMFFFKNNPLVDSCMSESDPGYQHLLWLGSVLNQFRALGIKCWIISHVPIIQKNLEPSCFLKINLWVHEYSDVVIGNLMGHMNLDYFNVIKGNDLRAKLRDLYTMNALKANFGQLGDYYYDYDAGDYDDGDDDEPFFSIEGAAPVNKNAYMRKVKKEFKSLAANLDLDRLDLHHSKYHVVNVAGSIIPTFNPAFRIWQYNLTGSAAQASFVMDWKLFFDDLEREIDSETGSERDSETGSKIDTKTDTKTAQLFSGYKGEKKDKSIPKRKPSDLPLGPAYENQFGSPLSFVQYYLDLDELNRKYSKLMRKGGDEETVIKDIFRYQVEYTSDDLLALGGVNARDLTVRTYLKLMSGLVRRKKIWNRFLKWVFVSSGYESLGK